MRKQTMQIRSQQSSQPNSAIAKLEVAESSYSSGERYRPKLNREVAAELQDIRWQFANLQDTIAQWEKIDALCPERDEQALAQADLKIAIQKQWLSKPGMTKDTIEQTKEIIERLASRWEVFLDKLAGQEGDKQPHGFIDPKSALVSFRSVLDHEVEKPLMEKLLNFVCEQRNATLAFRIAGDAPLTAPHILDTLLDIRDQVGVDASKPGKQRA